MQTQKENIYFNYRYSCVEDLQENFNISQEIT